MTHSRTCIGALVLPFTIAAALAQAEDRKERPAFPHPVALAVSLERSTFEAREPVIAHITLTNLGDEPFRLSVRDDGAPYGVTFRVSRENVPETKHSLWLESNSPRFRDLELAPGESTGGDILALSDYGKAYVFPRPGRYDIRLSWYPGSGFALIYSDELRVMVLPPSRVNEDSLDRIELIALRYHLGEAADSVDLNSPEAEKGMDREGVLLLSKIIAQQIPHRVDPENNPEDLREGALVRALTELLERHPDSSYSGYIARFLGLVHIKTFEHDVSWGRAKVKDASGNPLEWSPSTLKRHPSYRKALDYLTAADKAGVWPRTTALCHIGYLQGMNEEWDKAAALCDTLRQKYRHVGGERLASKLQDDIKRYRAKLERRTRDGGE